MANLRTNNLSGEGGRNAIKGSVYFGGAEDYLDISSSAIAAAIPGGDEPYTIEMWVQFGRDGSDVDSGGSDSLIAYGSNSTRSYNGIDWTAIRNVWYADDLSYTVDLTDGAWHHIAATYDQTTRRLFVDGNLGASDTPSDHSVGTTNNGKIGASTGGVINRDFKGYISNLRITKRAIYTAAFTPPTRELTAVDDTMLLCCQDSDNVLQEATGKTITGYGRYEYLNDTELVTNGSGLTTTGWTNANTSTFTVEDGMIKVTRSGGTGPTAYQTITTVIGQQYTVSVNIQHVSGNYSDLRVYNGSDSSGTLLKFLRSTGTSTDGNISSTFTAESTSTTLFFVFDDGGNTGKFSQISVKPANYGDEPKLIPPYGVDAGNTFNGAITMNSLSWMYFPTGRTEERGRGRGVIMGGVQTSPSNPYMDRIDFITIPTMGNAIFFGDLSFGSREGAGAVSSTNRAIYAGGMGPSSEVATNSMSFITIPTQGNGTDYGDLTATKRQGEGCSNGVRGLFMGGENDSPASNTYNDVIDYCTIASLGNALDFGNLTEARDGGGACSSPTRGVYAGGFSNQNLDVIDYVTIATTGNATDFGDMTFAHTQGTGCSNATRGLFFGGRAAPTNYNSIEFITIASTGDATDFGDLPSTGNQANATASQTRGVNIAGNPASAPLYQNNTMSFVTIASTGDASDFGDIHPVRSRRSASDCHGGLS